MLWPLVKNSTVCRVWTPAGREPTEKKIRKHEKFQHLNWKFQSVLQEMIKIFFYPTLKNNQLRQFSVYWSTWWRYLFLFFYTETQHPILKQFIPFFVILSQPTKDWHDKPLFITFTRKCKKVTQTPVINLIVWHTSHSPSLEIFLRKKSYPKWLL